MRAGGGVDLNENATQRPLSYGAPPRVGRAAAELVHPFAAVDIGRETSGGR